MLMLGSMTALAQSNDCDTDTLYKEYTVLKPAVEKGNISDKELINQSNNGQPNPYGTQVKRAGKDVTDRLVSVAIAIATGLIFAKISTVSQ